MKRIITWFLVLIECVQGTYMTPRVINLALQYVTTAIGLSYTWKALKPHMQSLCTSVVFPLCCFNDEDEELWRDDPQEYIRKVSGAFKKSSKGACANVPRLATAPTGRCKAGYTKHQGSDKYQCCCQECVHNWENR